MSAVPPPAAESAPQQPKTYFIGTLRYDQQALYILFFWLMWNDFGISLIENIGSLNVYLMRAQGATFAQMALVGSVGALVLPWINPLVSTWSDRHRGPMGRRRPFLLFAAPFFAIFIGAYPYMPGLYHYMLRYHWLAALSVHFPFKGEIIFMGACSLVSGVFNSVLLAIFLYLYWDVVPDSVLGRFQSLSKIVSLLALIIWNFFIFGEGDPHRHPKTVYVGTAVFSLAIYLISTWKINEGDYPPPDQHKKGGVVAPVRAYFVECYSQPYYLWIFIASLLYQVGNQGGGIQNFYLNEDLHLSLTTIGHATGWVNTATTSFGMIFGFFIGAITDRLKPVRLIGLFHILMGLSVFGAFIYVRSEKTYIFWMILRNIVQFGMAIVVGAFTPEIFPREKLGQFCSAQAVFYQIIIACIAPFIGMLFDHIPHRIGFLWMAAFYSLAGLVYVKVYFNWKARHGQAPVPHAG